MQYKYSRDAPQGHQGLAAPEETRTPAWRGWTQAAAADAGAIAVAAEVAAAAAAAEAAAFSSEVSADRNRGSHAVRDAPTAGHRQAPLPRHGAADAAAEVAAAEYDCKAAAAEAAHTAPAAAVVCWAVAEQIAAHGRESYRIHL